jgi:hypothetical protein
MMRFSTFLGGIRKGPFGVLIPDKVKGVSPIK